MTLTLTLTLTLTPLQFVTPELVVMRSQLLEYFASVSRVAPEERSLRVRVRVRP